MPEKDKREEKPLPHKFGESVSFTLRKAFQKTSAGFEKADRFLWNLISSKEEKARAAQWEKRGAEVRQTVNKILSERTENTLSAVTEHILKHPAAGDSSAFAKIGWPENKETNAASAVAGTLRGVSGFLQRKLRLMNEEEARILKNGELLVKGKPQQHIRMFQVQTWAHGALESQAKDIWNWVHALAASGEAPNLLPGFKIESKDGALLVKKNPQYDGAHSESSADELKINLWREDREAAVAKRIPAAKPADTSFKPTI